MGFYKVFTNDGQELKAYINDNEQCFISVNSAGCDNGCYSGYIALDKEDLSEFINYLITLNNELDG